MNFFYVNSSKLVQHRPPLSPFLESKVPSMVSFCGDSVLPPMISVQPEHGDEKTALASIHSLFSISREILKGRGRDCQEFTKIAVPVLNQIVRPFTAKWHRLSLSNAFDEEIHCTEFRCELSILQGELRKYTRMLSTMAGVEDLSQLEGREEEV